jgi:hypothetical protein
VGCIGCKEQSTRRGAMRNREGKELLRFVDSCCIRDKGGSETVGVHAAAASVGNPRRGDRV